MAGNVSGNILNGLYILLVGQLLMVAPLSSCDMLACGMQHEVSSGQAAESAISQAAESATSQAAQSAVSQAVQSAVSQAAESAVCQALNTVSALPVAGTLQYLSNTVYAPLLPGPLELLEPLAKQIRLLALQRHTAMIQLCYSCDTAMIKPIVNGKGSQAKARTAMVARGTAVVQL